VAEMTPLEFSAFFVASVHVCSRSRPLKLWPSCGRVPGREQADEDPWATKHRAYAQSPALALIAGGLKYWRQEAALDLIDTELVTARQQAQQVRTAFAKLEQRQRSIIYVFAKKQNEPTLLDIGMR
jgi:hypothetical protein